MYDHTLPQDQAETQAVPAEPTERAGWQAPDFTVVDTAMEITAYALSAK
jgi:coenzyme PQQ precursor peptide PqqA